MNEKNSRSEKEDIKQISNWRDVSGEITELGHQTDGEDADLCWEASKLIDQVVYILADRHKIKLEPDYGSSIWDG